MRRMAPLRAALVPLALWAVAGCGLLGVGREPIDFRTYELRGLPYERVAPLVLEVTRRYLTEGYDGVALAWDPDARTVRSDPVYSDDGRRRLTLYMQLVPVPEDEGVDVEMLALVETLDSESLGAVRWVRPQMDVTFERELYEAMVAAVVEATGS